MEIKPVTLTGKVVRLEPMSESHVPGLAEAGAGDERIWQHMLYGDIRTESEMLGWVRDILKRPDLPFTVFHLGSGRIAGATRYLNITPEHRGMEIGGTWYGADFRRTAVNTECKYLLLKHAFETLGCIRVQLKTDDRNLFSQKAIERIGAKREGILRNHMILPNGRFRNSVIYSVINIEWPEVKENLEKNLGESE